MKYTPKSIKHLPELNGVYIFKDKQAAILYIGKAVNLRKRVSSYFQKNNLGKKTNSLVERIVAIETILVATELEALLLEAKLIKQYQPKYNIAGKDDKHFIYIKITSDVFPRILFSRRQDDNGATYFGPFPSFGIVRKLLCYLRSFFPYCTQNPAAAHSCFYTHLYLCNPCPADIAKMHGSQYFSAKRIYLANIRQIKWLLRGRINSVKNYLQEQMKYFSQRQDYEAAADFRDKLNQLEYLLSSYHPSQAYIENPELFAQTVKSGTAELIQILKRYFTHLTQITRIECYDVSNIAGKFATGSLVTFINGLPAKDYYRRFRIKTVSQMDDFAMLSELLRRRLAHKEWRLPDLLLIDGGKPQLVVLKRVLDKLDVHLPLIGLAKKEEEIVVPWENQYLKLKLPGRSSALQLIQRLRDEAHRFAHKYHQLLRLKYLTS